jgi:hypothetical protein
MMVTSTKIRTIRGPLKIRKELLGASLRSSTKEAQTRATRSTNILIKMLTVSLHCKLTESVGVGRELQGMGLIT